MNLLSIVKDVAEKTYHWIFGPALTTVESPVPTPVAMPAKVTRKSSQRSAASTQASQSELHLALMRQIAAKVAQKDE